MRLILPEPDVLDPDIYTDDWSYRLRYLRADTIKVYDFCPMNPDGIPQASSNPLCILQANWIQHLRGTDPMHVVTS